MLVKFKANNFVGSYHGMWISRRMLVFIAIFNFKYFIMEKYIAVYVIIFIWISLIVIAVRDIAKLPYKERNKKIVWTNVVVLFPFLGLIVYYLIGRKSFHSDRNIF